MTDHRDGMEDWGVDEAVQKEFSDRSSEKT